MTTSRTVEWQPRWWQPELRRSLLPLPLAVVVYFVLPGGADLKMLAAWDVLAVGFLVLSWFTLDGRSLGELRRLAEVNTSLLGEDNKEKLFSRTMFEWAPLLAMVATLGVLPKADEQALPEPVVVTLCLAGVLVSWLVMHVGFLSMYVDEYLNRGGLDFPGEQEPAIDDFAYFAIGIGTSFGTTDVSVTRREMRRKVLVHGVMSFFFNTTVIAIAVTFVISYLSP